MSLKFPAYLKKGDTIGIVSPSSTNDSAIIEKGAAFLEQNGYKVFMHPQNYLQRGQLAGGDAEKIAAITEMFVDPKINGIICARGGNGAIRLLDKIDFELIARNPKIFVGYSDITVLLQSISKQCGFVTYHGPMLSSFGRDFDPRTATDFFSQIEGRAETLEVSGVEVISEGIAEGILVGGNMTMLQNLVGTPFDWQIDKAILFIEDVDEVLYRIDRMLWHFKLAGRLSNIAAVLVGQMIDTPDGETSHMRLGDKPYGYQLGEMLAEKLPGIPVCMNFPCGHDKYITTLPVGERARVTLNKQGARLDFTQH